MPMKVGVSKGKEEKSLRMQSKDGVNKGKEVKWLRMQTRRGVSKGRGQNGCVRRPGREQQQGCAEDTKLAPLPYVCELEYR
jgi:hypothetical protein